MSDVPPGPLDDADDAERTVRPGTEPGDAARPEHDSDEEEIDEAGDESFPASDAPQWWSGEPETDE